MDTVETIRAYYDGMVETEWARIENRPEFLLTCRFIDRYVKPGQSVLDIGGGPGRYSLYLAKKGCDVTLFDLSSENAGFAACRAAEMGVPLKTVVGDARAAHEAVQGPFDHVLLMGPLYHLLEEADRVRAVEAALMLLKPNGLLFASFINMIAGIIYAMKLKPDIVSDPVEQEFHNAFMQNKSFAGAAFTQAYFATQQEILPFMERFPLEKLHFFSQEGITAPCEGTIMSQPDDVISLWLDLCENTCEREELLSWGEHLMYIGRKKG